MSLEPVKVGTAPVGTMPMPGADATAPTQKSGAATFFKAIGEKMANAFKAIGEGISNLAPKHKPTSETLSPGSKAVFSEFRELLKKADKLEKLDNPTPAQQAKLQQVKDEIATARAEVCKHLKQQFMNGELYDAALNEPDQLVFNTETFPSNGPAGELATALRFILKNADKVDKIMSSGMKIDEAVAMYVYTQGAYTGINRELRGGTPSPFIQQFTEAVTSGLSRLPPFEEPVYRVVSLPPSVDKQYQPGATVSDRGLLSTTYNVDMDFLGGGTSHVLSIVGYGDSAGRDISWLSETPTEKEVLFPPGTEFVVKQRDHADTPKVLGKLPDGGDQFDRQVGILLVQKPK